MKEDKRLLVKSLSIDKMEGKQMLKNTLFD